MWKSPKDFFGIFQFSPNPEEPVYIRIVRGHVV